MKKINIHMKCDNKMTINEIGKICDLIEDSLPKDVKLDAFTWN